MIKSVYGNPITCSSARFFLVESGFLCGFLSDLITSVTCLITWAISVLNPAESVVGKSALYLIWCCSESIIEPSLSRTFFVQHYATAKWDTRLLLKLYALATITISCSKASLSTCFDQVNGAVRLDRLESRDMHMLTCFWRYRNSARRRSSGGRAQVHRISLSRRHSTAHEFYTCAVDDGKYAIQISDLSHSYGERQVSSPSTVYAWSCQSACLGGSCSISLMYPVVRFVILASCSKLKLLNFGKRFDGEESIDQMLLQVLRSANLEVQEGTLHILAGANGCGKSTMLRILGGLCDLQSGRIKTSGTVGMVLQNPDHQIVMPTVGAEVAFGLGRSNMLLCMPVAAKAALLRHVIRAEDMPDDLSSLLPSRKWL